jgi:hypothetical protein
MRRAEPQGRTGAAMERGLLYSVAGRRDEAAARGRGTQGDGR